MGDNVSDDDETSRTPIISLPCVTLHHHALPYLALLCLSFSILCREIMRKLEPSQRAMRRDQPKTPEPMRGTLPNTDQPRIPHLDYGHNWRRRPIFLCKSENNEGIASVASFLLPSSHETFVKENRWFRLGAIVESVKIFSNAATLIGQVKMSRYLSICPLVGYR